jgi:acetolactate synthase small subunit
MPTVHLTLQTQPGTDALQRVVCISRRRNLQIVALSYVDREIAITLRGDERQVRGIDRWLASLVDVFGVARRDLVTAYTT